MIDEDFRYSAILLIVIVVVCVLTHIATLGFDRETYIFYPPATPTPTEITSVVFVTETGEKYHMRDCRYLKYGCRKISIDLALKKGYTACSQCKPPKIYQ